MYRIYSATKYVVDIGIGIDIGTPRFGVLDIGIDIRIARYRYCPKYIDIANLRTLQNTDK